jgi:hypothetical protein
MDDFRIHNPIHNRRSAISFMDCISFYYRTTRLGTNSRISFVFHFASVFLFRTLFRHLCVIGGFCLLLIYHFTGQALSAAIGYGNAAGYLYNKGIMAPPPASAAGDDVNPITGKLLSLVI